MASRSCPALRQRRLTAIELSALLGRAAVLQYGAATGGATPADRQAGPPLVLCRRRRGRRLRSTDARFGPSWAYRTRRRRIARPYGLMVLTPEGTRWWRSRDSPTLSSFDTSGCVEHCRTPDGPPDVASLRPSKPAVSGWR